MKATHRVVTAIAALFIAAAVTIGARPAQTVSSSSDRLTADVLKGLEFRSIGPAISTGRVQDIAIDPKSPNTWYVATAFRGLWKTTNRGTTLTPIFDNVGSFKHCFLSVDSKNSSFV